MKKLRTLLPGNITLKQILIDLFIVFCGVYMAFYLTDRAEQNRINKQSVRILRSLKIELEQMRIFFPGQAAYMDQQAETWMGYYQEGKVGDYYDWRYLQPQYNYTVLEYAINERETEILDFELYKNLLDLYRNIRQLEQAETYMTEMGLEYNANIGPGDPDYLKSDNLYHFYRFIGFARDRASALDRVAEMAAISVEQINQKFSRKELMDMTIEMAQRLIDRSNQRITKEAITQVLAENFAYFTETERNQIINRLKFPDS